MTGTIRVGCMAHARRKFDEAAKVVPHGVTRSRRPAHVAIDLIGKLYEIEARIKGLDHRDRHKVRTEESVLVLKKFKDWLNNMYPQVVPKSALGRAVGYHSG